MLPLRVFELTIVICFYLQHFGTTALQCYYCKNCKENEELQEMHICGELPFEPLETNSRTTTFIATTTLAINNQDSTTTTTTTERTTTVVTTTEGIASSSISTDETRITNQATTIVESINANATTTTATTTAAANEIFSTETATGSETTTETATETEMPTETETETTTETETETTTETETETTIFSETSTTESQENETTEVEEEEIPNIVETSSTSQITTAAASAEGNDLDEDYLDYETNDYAAGRQNYISQKYLQARQVNASPICYMLTAIVNGTVVINRGCANMLNDNKQDTCSAIYDNTEGRVLDCQLCNTNACNKFSTANPTAGTAAIFSEKINFFQALSKFFLVILMNLFRF